MSDTTTALPEVAIPDSSALKSVPPPDTLARASGAPQSGGAMSPAQCAERLKELFPALFSGPVKPLKLRIQVDIQERAPGVFSKQVLSSFFRRHTGSTAYLIAVSKASHRIDLDGQPAGEVSPEHKQLALDELARRRSNVEARREQEMQARQRRASLLRNFQNTKLTRANFCALNGLPEESLDAVLAQAELEAKEAAQRSQPASSRGPRELESRPGQRRADKPSFARKKH